MSININGSFKFSSVTINSKHFASTASFLSFVLGLRIKKPISKHNGVQSLHLMANSEDYNGFELIVTDDPVAAINTPIQIGVQSLLCQLSDTIRILDYKGLYTESLDEARSRLNMDVPSSILFKNPAFSEFYLETRPLIDLKSLDRWSQQNDFISENLSLLNNQNNINEPIFEKTAIETFRFKGGSIDNYIQFFDAIDLDVDADSDNGLEWVRFNTNWLQFRIDRDETINSGMLGDPSIEISVANINKLQLEDILKVEGVTSINKHYQKFPHGILRSLSIEDQNNISWDILNHSFDVLKIA